jgi:hypothetical protein
LDGQDNSWLLLLRTLLFAAARWVIAHFQRIATVDYLTALGINLPLYPGALTAAAALCVLGALNHHP